MNIYVFIFLILAALVGFNRTFKGGILYASRQ